MTAGERFKNWIDSLSGAWKDRLRGWFASWVMDGVIRVMDFLEPDLRAEIKSSLLRIRDIPGLPDDFKSLIDKTVEEPKAIHLAAILPYLIGIMIGLGMGAAAPMARIGSYQIDKFIRSARLDPITAFRALWRGFITEGRLIDSLTDQGYSDDDIETLRNVLKFYPAPADLVRWQAREVFEPEMIARYGLDSEYGEIEKEPFYKAGMTDEQIRNYWRAHWEHASWIQVVEMLRRGQLTESEVRDWFRLVEIPPFWRDKLIAISWAVPTRVDVRRFWDMRTIDETRLREIYTWQGYHGKDLDDYVLWTKVYVAFPDLMARWKNGWITLEDVKSELTGLGMPAARVEEMLETKIKSAQPERTTGERDLTKSDIYKGVKQGRITRGEASELLMDLGFDEDEADLLLATNIPPDEEDEVVNERQLSKADILKGLKTEVITMDEASTKLLDLRYSPTDVEFLLNIYQAQVKPPEEPRAREASKADIVLGVKKGLITQEEGYGMLLDIGFTPEAAGFILTVKTEETPFSPINFAEFKELTQRYRIAVGREAKPMTEELKVAADEVVRLSAEVESLSEAVKAEEGTLVDEEVLPEAATAKLDELRVALHRAEAELAAAKSHYDSMLAEWRHKPPS